MYRKILASRQMPCLIVQSKRTNTDINYYKVVEKSHLHEVDAQSPKRKFLLKLDKLERDKIAAEKRRNASTKTRLNPNDLEPIELPKFIERGPSDVLR